MRRLLSLLVLAALVGAVAVGLLQAGGEGSSVAPPSARPDPDRARAALKGAPAPLARVHAQANQLLDGGPAALRTRLAELRGHPVVVNKWASWCGPCRAEFPVFQQTALRYGRRVAFLGVDVSDGRGGAAAFLERFPLSYPSYFDPRGRVSAAIGAPQGQPITVFYDRRGRRTTLHTGPFQSVEDLSTAVERYALAS